MLHSEFMSVLHHLIDKYESYKGSGIWKESGTNVLDDFYDYCDKRKYRIAEEKAP